MGTSWSYSHVIPTMISRCRRRVQELPIYHDETTMDSIQHTLERKINEVELRQQHYQQQSHQYVHQQIQPYQLRLQENIQQIELIKQKIQILEENQKILIDNQIIEI